jgi:hypothetical protein
VGVGVTVVLAVVLDVAVVIRVGADAIATTAGQL